MSEWKPQPYLVAEEARNAERLRRLFAPNRTCKGCGAPEITNCDADCAYADQHDWKYHPSPPSPKSEMK
jgi:hypothetical protein